MSKRKSPKIRPVAKPGLFCVEGRAFENERHAVSFAFALACEYARHINVYFGAPDGNLHVAILTEFGRVA